MVKVEGGVYGETPVTVGTKATGFVVESLAKLVLLLVWTLNGGVASLDLTLETTPATKRFAMVTYDAGENTYTAEYFDKSHEACDAAAETLTGFPGYLCAIIDLAAGRVMKINTQVSAI